jgi:NMD protein affecting ribosome stability and mRNA decay
MPDALNQQPINSRPVQAAAWHIHTVKQACLICQRKPWGVYWAAICTLRACTEAYEVRPARPARHVKAILILSLES